MIESTASASFAARTAQRTITLLLAFAPLTFAVRGPAKTLVLTMLLFYGLYLIARNQRLRAGYRAMAPVVCVCLATVLFCAVNISSHGLGWNEFDLTAQILLFLGIAATFMRPFRLRWIWCGFSATAAVLGLACAYSRYVQGAVRASAFNSGEWGVIELAMFMLVLSLVSVVILLRAETAPGERIYHAACAVLGIFGALLTQSRGPLLAFVPIFVLVIFLAAYRTRRWHAPAVVLLSMMAIAIALTAVAGGDMSARFCAIAQEARTYSGNNVQGAIRERVQMWQVASRALREHPLTGVGMGQFGQYTQAQVRQGLASNSIAKYEHPHNEYLEAAAGGGLPGLVLLLLLLGVPLFFFARHALDPADDVATPATVGVLTVSMYALCGLTDNVFYRAMPHSLFFFLVLGMAALIARPGHRTAGAQASSRADG